MARTVVVTGGFGALGSAVGGAFADRGERVVLIDRADRVPEGLQARVGNAQCLPGVDLADPASAQQAMRAAAEPGGVIDVLVNIAGGFDWQTLVDGDVDVWRRMFEMNLETAVVASKAALPQLLQARHGRVINVGAGAAARASAGMGAYTASKAGVERFTESLAEELKDKGVTVNAILPGTIDTPRNRADMPDADPARWVAPEDIAAVIVFLASQEARAVTGAAIRVFGRG
ncbi:MAG TPA: SDR family NAD(P)-dependent oxidoreductase [Steroidobacteraceae bacterium]|nr:SDR family NAD(P)-dependent oxidoreductase [Steroidobacteraceae bacterium]